MPTPRAPAEAFPPGEYLRDELDARDWTQADLAVITGRTPATINGIITGKRRITPELARDLGAALDTSPQFWLNLENTWQLANLPKRDQGVSLRAKLYERAPVHDMIRRGWIEHSNNVGVLERQVLEFLRVDSIDEEPEVKVAARATRNAVSGADWSLAQRAWFLRALELAEDMDAPRFTARSLKGALRHLRELLDDMGKIADVPDVLHEAGIRFLVVEHLPGTKIDGATMWLNRSSPVVALTLRLERIDYFWHTLLHELGHVSEGDASVDVEIGKAGDREEDPREVAADQFAASFLVDQKVLEQFILGTRPRFSEARIKALAAQLGVHPSIPLGQLKHRGEVPWRNLAKFHGKVRSIVLDTAVCDGWGLVPDA